MYFISFPFVLRVPLFCTNTKTKSIIYLQKSFSICLTWWRLDDLLTPDMRNKCLFPKCKSEDANLRGLCRSHYNQAAKAILSGKTTWDKLVKARKAKANTKRGPKFKNTHFAS